jgi:hypothetical protein
MDFSEELITKTMLRRILSILILLLLLSSCYRRTTFEGNIFNIDGIEGRGDLITATRSLKPFNQIQLTSDVRLIISKDSVLTMLIEAQPNIIEEISAEVYGTSLVIRNDNGITNYKPISIYITAPSFSGIIVEGKGSVEGRANFPGDVIYLLAKGSGSINLSLKANTVNSIVLGSGDINLS